MHFNIDLPKMLIEISNNNETWALVKPLQITQIKLSLIAKRAIELDDPELNILMLETKLYHTDSHSEIKELIETQKKRIKK